MFGIDRTVGVFNCILKPNMDKIKIYQKQDVEIIKNIKFLNLIFVYSNLKILQFCMPFESHKFTKINKQKRIFIAKK